MYIIGGEGVANNQMKFERGTRVGETGPSGGIVNSLNCI